MVKFAAQHLDRVVDRIISGEVVFLVGAGFSLDSEGNSAQRLIARLIARFAALTEPITPAVGEDLREGLRVTFGLGDTPLDAPNLVSRDKVRELASQYYHFNEWICGAYSILLDRLLRQQEFASKLSGEISVHENQLLRMYDPSYSIGLKPLDLKQYETLAAEPRGKALFLQTMGFCDSDVMAGDPMQAHPFAVAESYRGILRDRHVVLARLAREGAHN